MNKEGMIPLLCTLLWLLVSAIIAGVQRELNGSWRDWEAALFWPFFLGVGAVWGLALAVTWLGRGPVRLVVYLRNKPTTNLPKARKLPEH